MKQQRLVQRQHPLFSPLAGAGTAVLLLLLAVGLWLTGGRAFSPGDLSTSARSPQQSGGFAHHAAFADDCTQCHDPFVGVTAGRCETCHVNIAQQRESETGLHGRLTTPDCAACHSEHQGHDFDLYSAAFDQFSTEHHAALFPLHGQHATLECTDCHQNEQYAGTSATCVGCHAEPDLHKGLLGTDCARCHTPEGWRPALLTDHTFPLDHGDGLPAGGQILCATCHTTTFTTYTCDNCHDPAEMIEEHQEEGITPAELTNCIECHPTGEED